MGIHQIIGRCATDLSLEVRNIVDLIGSTNRPFAISMENYSVMREAFHNIKHNACLEFYQDEVYDDFREASGPVAGSHSMG